jgi:catechol 2,3-dioxygenase-like lactoylglutathione lyase family enzyme
MDEQPEESMTRTWPIIAVDNVAQSAAWYTRLLNANNNHPGATVFDQILDADGTVLLCLHHWGPSGARGDHQWASLAQPSTGQPGNGLLLWFVVDDFDSAWERAQAPGTSIVETPNNDNGTSMRAFVVRDPDGYHVAVNETYR